VKSFGRRKFGSQGEKGGYRLIQRKVSQIALHDPGQKGVAGVNNNNKGFEKGEDLQVWKIGTQEKKVEKNAWSSSALKRCIRTHPFELQQIGGGGDKILSEFGAEHDTPPIWK